MFRKRISIGFVTGAILVFATMALAAKIEKFSITSDSVLPGGQQLQAGKYEVMVDDGAKQVKFMLGSKIVATHAFKVVELGQKNQYSQARYAETADKKQQLQELRLSGEKRSLVLTEGGV